MGLAIGILLVALILLLSLGVAASFIGGHGFRENIVVLGMMLAVPLAFIVIGARYVVIGKEAEKSSERRQRSRQRLRRNRKKP